MLRYGGMTENIRRVKKHEQSDDQMGWKHTKRLPDPLNHKVKLTYGTTCAVG